MADLATRHPAIRAGEIDWPARWRATVEAREGSGTGDFLAGGSRWDGRAERFARMARLPDPTADPFVNALSPTIQPSDSVLDVGAGAGRYCLPIASRADRVTAVEPSSRMRDQLAQAATARGLRNLTIVPSNWEDAEVETHDVAFTANVLYFVPDAVGFIEKLDQHARRACFVLHRVEERAAPLLPLWKEVWGHPRPPEPSAVDLYNLLFAIGIRPNVRLAPQRAPIRFETSQDAMRQARQSLNLEADDRTHDERIAAFLREVVVKRDGLWEFPPGPQMAIISWEKD